LADADLEDDHRLAVFAGKSAGCLELIEILDRFEIAEDDLRRRVLRQKGNIVGAVEADFIAARDELANLNPAVRQDVIGVEQDAAALADQRHLARSNVELAMVDERDEAAVGNDVAG